MLVPFVESAKTRGVMLGETLTLQLYPAIAAPLGSVTADHDIVVGTVTFAPLIGPRGVGAGGAAAAMPPATTQSKTMKSAKAFRKAAIAFASSAFMKGVKRRISVIAVAVLSIGNLTMASSLVIIAFSQTLDPLTGRRATSASSVSARTRAWRLCFREQRAPACPFHDQCLQRHNQARVASPLSQLARGHGRDEASSVPTLRAADASSTLKRLPRLPMEGLATGSDGVG